MIPQRYSAPPQMAVFKGRSGLCRMMSSPQLGGGMRNSDSFISVRGTATPNPSPLHAPLSALITLAESPACNAHLHPLGGVVEAKCAGCTEHLLLPLMMMLVMVIVHVGQLAILCVGWTCMSRC